MEDGKLGSDVMHDIITNQRQNKEENKTRKKKE
jgi:hypothetical protein